MQAWNVIINGRLFDTVYYQTGYDANYVKQTLIDHDGYPKNIRVCRGKND